MELNAKKKKKVSKKYINIGDLVQKTGGYGSECNWVGLFLGYYEDLKSGSLGMTVLHEGEVDHWLAHCVEKVH